MKRFIYKLSPFLFFLFAIITTSLVVAQQTSTTDWTEKSAKKWVKSREWSNGLSIKLSSTVNNIEFAKQYRANKEYWDKAFQFMREKNLKEMSPGKYVID